MRTNGIRKRHAEQLEAALDMLRRSQEELPLKPALISWCRIALVPVCLLVGWNGDYVAMFWLTALGAASDYLDGWYARRTRSTSTPGKTLDMLADKLFLAVMLIFLTRLGALNAVLGLIPAWYHIIVVLGLLMVSWSISVPVVAITTSERLTIILSYVLVVTASGTLAFPFKTIFIKLTGIISILTPIAAVLGVVSYFRLSRRLIQRYMN